MELKYGIRSTIDYLSRVQRKADKIQRNYGIDIPLKTDEIHLLDLIHSCPDINLTQLAEKMWAGKMVISQLVRRLESKGLLVVINGKNKKELACKLTEKGKVAVDTHDAFHRMESIYLSEKLDQYTGEEIALVNRFLRDYAEYLEKYAQDSTIL